MALSQRLLLLTVIAVVVDCRPQDLAFPEDSQSGSSSAEDRIPQNPFSGRPGARPQNGNNQRPNIRPGQFNVGNNPSFQNGRPGQFPSGNNPFNSQNGSPNDQFSSQNGRPGQFPSGNNPFNSQNGSPNDQFSSQNGRPGQIPSGNNPIQSQNGSSQRGTTTTPAPAGGSTLPPRDPTNRIVYTVSCQLNPPCQHTSQYSPVCGTDGQTYGNIGILYCEQQCPTKSVERYMDGACPRSG